jgi:hypothetical protein
MKLFIAMVSLFNKNGSHNITEILLIVTLNSTKQIKIHVVAILLITVKVKLKGNIHLGFYINYVHA